MRDLKMFLGWMVVVMLVIGFTPSVANAEENVFFKDGELQYKDKSVWTKIDVDGDKGDKGDTGAKGQKGDKGAKGQKGDTGAKGQKGDKGAKGQKGDKGAKGQKGDRGVNGQDGANGQDGVNGQDFDTRIIVDLTDLSNAGTASSFAMSQTNNRPDDGFRVGLGQFNNQTAIAFGGRQADVTFGLSFDTQDNIGVSFGFDF